LSGIDIENRAAKSGTISCRGRHDVWITRSNLSKRTIAAPLQQALQLLDQRMEGAMYDFGGTAKGDPRRLLVLESVKFSSDFGAGGSL